MAKLLITGASGLLGSNLLLHAMEGHQVVAVTHTHPVSHPQVHHLSADLSEPGVAAQIMKETQPEP